MKKWFIIALISAGLFGCFRQEIQVEEYSVPEMKKAEAALYLQKRIKTVPGVRDVSYSLDKQTLTVIYDSNTARVMNIEESIALAGFSANGRPANPNAKAKLPASMFE